MVQYKNSGKLLRLLFQLIDRRVGSFILLLAIDAVFFTSINPANTPSILLVLGFLLCLLTVYGLCFGLCGLVAFYITGLRKQRKYLSLLLTILFGVALALQTIGQFSPRDLLVIIPIGLILYVYLIYNRSRQLRS